MSNVVPVAVSRRQGAIGRFMGGWSIAAGVFLAPALLLLLVFMVYPTVSTIVLSFQNGLDNHVRLLTQDPKFLSFSSFPPRGALVNNVLWVIFYVGGCIIFGLLIAGQCLLVSTGGGDRHYRNSQLIEGPAPAAEPFLFITYRT